MAATTRRFEVALNLVNPGLHNAILVVSTRNRMF
jgi:hypothetical protein